MFTPARYNKVYGFEDLFNEFAFPAFRGCKAMPEMRTDIKENDNGYELAIDIPGFKKEDVKAQLKDGYLTVSAESKDEKEENDENGKFICRERYFGSMKRSYYVGNAVTEEDIKANFSDGTLKLFVPKDVKKEVPEEKFIAIEG
ncbi:MAG: Hsp20/alpha crystallin family protein [Lachnospiraceae bacterium]|nr:Hsp20/alpha crystallin family protein [Lachnospiraceae bacterium]